MKKASIVLGLQFGDEGKGRTVDYLIKQEVEKELKKEIKKKHLNQLVVRFSGGQQAGHTVVVDDKRHVFSTYGSGTLRGVPTFISKYCTFYLNSMFNERNILLTKVPRDRIKLIVDPLAMLTTPFDVLNNRMSEKTKKHGSCGMGVGTTMNRNIKSMHKLYVIDLLNPLVLTEKLISIEKYYKNVASSIFFGKELDSFYEEQKTICDKELENFLWLAENWKDFFTISNDIGKYEHFIFEGSQGIMLDMDHGIFPNVTYANTTSKNALEMCKELRIHNDQITTYYVTRTYKTRHGTGWFGDETEVDVKNNENETNISNPWQGEFKVAKLDPKLIDYAYKVDRIYNKSKHCVIVTCADQVTYDFDLRKTSLHEEAMSISVFSKDSN